MLLDSWSSLLRGASTDHCSATLAWPPPKSSTAIACGVAAKLFRTGITVVVALAMARLSTPPGPGP
jgi:hypothetical protein